MLFNARLPPSIKFAGTHLETWAETGTVTVKCQLNDLVLMSSSRSVEERPPGVWEVMGSIPVVDSNFCIVPRSCHVDRFPFHISSPSLKFTPFIHVYIITKSMHALWLVSQLWVIVPVNPRKNRASSGLLYKSNRPQVSVGYRLISHACGSWYTNSSRVLQASRGDRKSVFYCFARVKSIS